MKTSPYTVSIRPAAIGACLAFAAHAHGAVNLGTAASFGILGASTVTNTGPTVITGDLGVSPGTAITGFPPGTITGTSHSNDAVAVQAQVDAKIAYDNMALLPAGMILTGSNLGGLTLLPGVYFFSTSADLTGILTLNGNGEANPEFIFQIGSTFIAASSAAIITIGGANPSQVYFQVGSSATLGTNSEIVGTIIANTSVTFNTGADLTGRAIALTGAVTLDTNQVVPEPSSAVLLVSGLVSLFTLRRRPLIKG